MNLIIRYDDGGIECGLDEAGRGCLAGPVFAAAVILPDGFIINGLDDSKKLSPKKRESLRQEIEAHAVAFAVASVEPEIIDQINILQASIQAMHMAIRKLNITPKRLLVDGNRFNPFPGMEHICIIGGDARYASIAAASILAKTYRDAYMENAHRAYPMYDWKHNKGYPTLTHVQAIRLYGLSPYHRKSFNCKGQTRLPF